MPRKKVHQVQSSSRSSEDGRRSRRGYSFRQEEGATGKGGGWMDIAPSMTVEAFMASMLAGLPDPRCAQCVREQGPLTVVGGQMDDVATAWRGWAKHNSYGFGTISTHLPTTPSDLA